MGEELTAKIIEAIAEFEGKDPTALNFRLADHIDPDAIRQLSTNGTASWTLEFELPDHTVTVTSEDRIQVDENTKELKNLIP